MITVKCSTVVQSACSCDDNSDDDDDHSNDGYNGYLLSCTRFLHCFNLECHTSHVVSSHITPLR